MNTTSPSHPPMSLIGPRLSVMMFLEFFVWGAWYVTMGPFMASRQMSGEMIGWAYSLAPIAAIVSPFFLGMVADRFFATERVLGVMHVLGGLILMAAPSAASNANLFLVVILGHTLCFMPTLGLTNSLSFHHMNAPEKQFPLIRVFGTIGWVAANWVISAMKYDMSPNMFYVAGLGAVALGLYSFTLPHTPPPAKGKKASARDVLGLDALALLKDPSFAVFVLCSFLVCIPLAAYYSFAGEYTGATGFKAIASTMSLGQVSEIFFMLMMPLFFARLGVKWMMALGMVAWAVRYGLFAGAWGQPTDQAKWFVLGGIILHGICYDFFFVAGSIYVDKRATPQIRGQAQGFLVLITQGLGLGIGAQIMGRIASQYSSKGPTGVAVREWDKIWLFPCIAAAVILVIFVAVFRDKTAKTPTKLT